MNYRIILNNSFLKEAKRLAKKYYSFKEDLETLQNELKINPHSGVDLGNGFNTKFIAEKTNKKAKKAGITLTAIIISGVTAKTVHRQITGARFSAVPPGLITPKGSSIASIFFRLISPTLTGKTKKSAVK